MKEGTVKDWNGVRNVHLITTQLFLNQPRDSFLHNRVTMGVEEIDA